MAENTKTRRGRYGAGTCTPRTYRGKTLANQWKLRVNLPPGPDGKRREYTTYFKGTKTEAHRKLADLVARRSTLIPVREQPPPDRRTYEALKGITGYERPTYDLDQKKLSKILRGSYGRTMEDLMKAWADHIEQRGRSRSYVTQVRNKTRLRINPVLGQIPVADLDAQHLDDFYTSLLREGLKDSTVRQLHAFLSSALSQAVKWDWIDRSPIEKATPPTVRVPDLPCPTPEEVQALLQAADGTLHRAILLAALTGARRGELCALRWRDLNTETGTLAISKAMANGVEGDTKTHQQRTLAIDPEALGTPGSADSFILTGTDRPASANVLTQRFKALAVSLGMPFTFHSLRRFSATTLIAEGVDPRTVISRQGWSSMQMLNRYAKPVTKADRAAADVLGKALNR